MVNLPINYKRYLYVPSYPMGHGFGATPETGLLECKTTVRPTIVV